jgi:hypothetical protein
MLAQLEEDEYREQRFDYEVLRITGEGPQQLGAASSDVEGASDQVRAAGGSGGGWGAFQPCSSSSSSGPWGGAAGVALHRGPQGEHIKASGWSGLQRGAVQCAVAVVPPAQPGGSQWAGGLRLLRRPAGQRGGALASTAL